MQAISHHLRHEAMTELKHQVKRVELVIFLLDWGVKKRALLCAQKEPKSEKKGRALKFQTKTENYQVELLTASLRKTKQQK